MNKYLNLEESQNIDNEINSIVIREYNRQKNTLQMIASENFVSNDVLRVQGSILTNKYAEGYPNRRYYQGCKFVDEIEEIAKNRVCKLFKCDYANVQPHSGSQANQAVYMALLKPGDTILGMDLSCGGHLTHGSKVNFSGKWFNAVSYGVTHDTGLIDLNEIEKLALKHKPKIIIAGASSYSRQIDFKAFNIIANKIGAFFMADVAHYAGLIAGNQYPNPFPYADVVTSTTHKTLRGPRGGLILTSNQDIAKKINSSIFPGIQGGPFMHSIAAKAVAFKEALSPKFHNYARQVIKNSKVLCQELQNLNYKIVSNGTDSHMFLIDLTNKELYGSTVSDDLEQNLIICNKNSIPYDTLPPKYTSGIRLGSAALTTRGMVEKDFIKIAEYIHSIIQGVNTTETKHNIKNLLKNFPLLYKN